MKASVVPLNEGLATWRAAESTRRFVLYALLAALAYPLLASAASLELRLLSAGICLALAGVVLAVPRARAYAYALQVVNVGALLVFLLTLFVEERHNEFAPAIVMLGIFGSQFAFVRRRDLATVYAACTVFLIVFAVYRGALGSTTLALMGTIVAAFAVAYATRSAHIATQLTLANERLRKDQTSHLDPLTGLQNRAVLFERLDGAIASAHRRRHDVALLYIDLNDFKQVNDTLGHRAGDDVLVQVGSRLKRAVRTDEVAARIGGDEFVVVLPHVERFNEPQEAAARIRRVLSDPYEVENRELRVGASIGVARSPYDGTDRDHLLGSADAAMYAEKRGVHAAL